MSEPIDLVIPGAFAADVAAVQGMAALPTILDVVCRTTGMGFAAVARVTGDRWIACGVKDDIAFGLLPGGELKVETTLCHEVRQHREAVVIDHVATDPSYCGHPTPALYGFQSYVSMPIHLPDGSFFGTLCAIDPKPARVNRPEIVGMFKMFADLIGFHLDALHRTASSVAERDRVWNVSRDMLGVADTAGVWRSVNPAWTRILGWDAAEILGRTSEWLEHPEDRAKTRREVARLASGRTTLAFENRFRSRNGDYRLLSWTAEPVEGLLYCVARDVTAERQQAQALRDSEDFARLALSAVGGVGVWTYDVASDRFTCDAAISELYGIDPVRGAAGVTREEFLRNLHPDDAAPLRATMAGGLDRSGDLELEYRIRHPDGSTRWLLSRGNTAFDEAGRPVRRTGIGVETTRLRQLEEELRQSQKMEAVGQLTGGVAHDFNNLLTVIKSSTDLLKRPNLSEERRTRYIAAISETVDRAARLTGQLLAFARRQALQPKVFDAGQSVKTLSDMIGTLMGGRVALVVEVADEPCPVEADPGQFDTALINMAVNARDAMAGVGQLVVAVRPVARVPAVRSHRAVDVPSVAVSIADTGAGIPPHRIDRIFEPFFTTKEVGQGTGLGLSQVFGFAKQSGGEVEVDSVEGEGTTFTLYLPRATSPLAADEPEDLGPTEDGQGISVLVIEDNRDVGTFVTQTLNELGYRTHLVASARAALDDLAATPGAHEIVFTDVVMPGMNGVELANEIRRLYPDLPVILTSGYSDVLAKDGGHGFALLQKPYSVEALSRALRLAVAKRRRREL